MPLQVPDPLPITELPPQFTARVSLCMLQELLDIPNTYRIIAISKTPLEDVVALHLESSTEAEVKTRAPESFPVVNLSYTSYLPRLIGFYRST